MCKLLIKAIDHTHSDSIKDRAGAYKRGYPVVVFNEPHEWGDEERPPKFYILTIPDATREEVEHFFKEWRFRINFEVMGSDLAIDGHRIRATATEFHAVTGEGKITRAKVETYLNNWGATVVSTGDNEVVFDVLIWDAIQSQGFWEGLDISDLIFTELRYIRGTGVHQVEINYGAKAFSAEDEREQYLNVLKSRFTNIVHDAIENTITGDTDRATVRGEFLQDIRDKTRNILVRRRYYFPAAVMDMIEAAGGYYTATKAQVLAYIRDKTTD